MCKHECQRRMCKHECQRRMSSTIFVRIKIFLLLSELALRAAFEMPPRNFIIGKSKILFLLRNRNYIIGKPSVLFLLRNSYFIIPTL
jgi:hypothetical protein